MTRPSILLALALALVGCGGALPVADGGTGATGDPCTSASDCAGGACLPLPGGYCSQDCAMAPCAAGEVCRPVAGATSCLKGCASAADCRTGFSCFQGSCQPPCTNDASCPTGFGCTSGTCTPLAGKAEGQPCKVDRDCSSRRCDRNAKVCRLACAVESDCPANETCFINPFDANNDNSTDSLQPVCIPRRARGSPIGGSCRQDKDCAQGQCELGVCVTLCQGDGSCPAQPPMSCVEMFAQLDIGAPKVNACLLRSGTLDFDLASVGNGGPVGMPSNARGFNLFVEAKDQDTDYYAGIASLDDPAGQSLYAPFNTLQEYLDQPIRYMNSEGTSTVLVSNSPARVPAVLPGLYSFGAFAATATGLQTTFSVRVRIKLAPSPPTAGTIPLHVLVTDLSGGCTTFTAADAPQRLAGAISTLKQVYQQANITIDPVQFFDSRAASSFTEPAKGPDLELHALLKQATAADARDVLELVIVKNISGGMQGFELLGIAGGIPASTGIPGTVHSGATASVANLCMDPSGALLGAVAAHELGHSMGLFHNYEQDGTTDPLTDTRNDMNSNLMFWEENGGQHLTPQQTQVLLANPAVH